MPDVRVVWMHRFLSLSLSKTLPLMVPRLLPLHRMLQQHSGSEPVQLPPSLSLSSEKLQEDGIYLAENGYDGYIYFAQQVNPQLVRALLGDAAASDPCFHLSCCCSREVANDSTARRQMRPALPAPALQRVTDAMLPLLSWSGSCAHQACTPLTMSPSGPQSPVCENDVDIPSCHIQVVYQGALFTSLQRVLSAACVDKPV